MTVRITKAAKETYWYAKHIGEEFEVVTVRDASYTVSDGEFLGWIKKSDCEVITEPTTKKKPEIICTIGSSRFCDIEAVMKWEFEKQGYVCIGMHLLPDWYIKEKGWTEDHHGGEQEGVAQIMDELHLRKIEMADKIFVINKDGYIGERTRFEINYATILGKPIEYLEADKPMKPSRPKLRQPLTADPTGDSDLNYSDADPGL